LSIKIYVGNLTWGTTNDSLRDLFTQYGEVVDANVVTDRQTGRSRGFGFVEMTDEAAGQKAIEALHGTDYEGRNLVVNVARPPKQN
jgi:RNA recognition motif-containing protein